MEGQSDSSSEVREVLNKYLELFQQNTIDFKYHLAPNSVIDWYGRTVRGANKIHDYLRHEVLNQFDHIEFLQAEACAPIETKTSHMRTKFITTKPIDNVHPINRVPDMVPLKSYADSDVDDREEQPVSSRFVGVGVGVGSKKTPEKCSSTSLPIANLTPPTSVKKEADHSEDEDDMSFKESRRRRLKRSHTGYFSYLKRLPTAAPSTSKRGKDSDTIITLLDDTSSEEDELEAIGALYTPLRYLEVKGTMNVKTSAMGSSKQRGALWRDRNQLETRIRISYRRKLDDRQLQFALIIYEPFNVANLTPPPRRNLMSEFAMTVEEAPQQQQHTSFEEGEEHLIEETVLETIPTMISIPQTSTFFGLEEDPLLDEPSMESLSAAQMRTPTKLTHTPPTTPRRKPRSLLVSKGLKRLNSSPSAPSPKRSAARSLRL